MPQAGDILGRYTLLRRIAVGGMGEVYIAVETGAPAMGPYVALKILREDLAADPQFVEMLVDEAHISKFLDHPNVVSVLDLGEDAGQHYIAMEYVQSITVERLAEGLYRRSETMPVPVALFIAVELCRALKYAHTRVNHEGEPLNIIHRDVTPANILLSIDGRVKLTDFGIARARGRFHQTRAGVLKGKLGYVAPEMVRYEEIDARADIFCAGIVLYLMVGGNHPVAGVPVVEAIERFERREVPPPSTMNEDVTPALDSIILRCLEPQPRDRWATAAALGEALEGVLCGTSAWGSVAEDGHRCVVEQIRSVAPDAFEPPVDPEKVAGILETVQVTAPTQGPAIATTRPEPASVEPSEQEELRPILPDQPFDPTPSVGLPGVDTDGDLPRVGGHVRAKSNVVQQSAAEMTVHFGDSSTERDRMAEWLLTEPERPASDPPPPAQVERTITNRVYARRLAYEDTAIEGPLGPAGVDGATAVDVNRPLPSEPEAMANAGNEVDRVEEGSDDADAEQDTSRRANDDPREVWAVDTFVPGTEGLSRDTAVRPTPVPHPSIFDATVFETEESSDLLRALEDTHVRAVDVSQADVPEASTITAPDFPGLLWGPSASNGARELPAPSATVPDGVEGPLRRAPDAGSPAGAPGHPRRLAPEAPGFGSAPARSTDRPSRFRRTDDPRAAAGPRPMPWRAGRRTSDALAWDDGKLTNRLVGKRGRLSGSVAPRSAADPTPLIPASPVAWTGHPSLSEVEGRASGPAVTWFMALGLLVFAGFMTAFVFVWTSSQVFWPKLTLDSVPPGAQVVVDGQRIPGRTPVVVKVSPGSRHRVEFSRKGYRTEKREITDKVSRLGKYALKVELGRRATRLYLSAEGTVFVNGEAMGTGREVLLTELPSFGPVTIRVEAKGHYPYQAGFDSLEELPESLDIPLRPYR